MNRRVRGCVSCGREVYLCSAGEAGSGSRNEHSPGRFPRSIAAEDPLLLGRGPRPALRRRRLTVVIGFVGVGLGAPEIEVAMGTHSSAPKVA